MLCTVNFITSSNSSFTSISHWKLSCYNDLTRTVNDSTIDKRGSNYSIMDTDFHHPQFPSQILDNETAPEIEATMCPKTRTEETYFRTSSFWQLDKNLPLSNYSFEATTTNLFPPQIFDRGTISGIEDNEPTNKE